MEGLDRERPLSLYIHVPFCSSKCDYCAFYSVPSQAVPDGAIGRYTDLVLGEISALRREWGRPFHTVFIGGGNPAMLGYRRIAEILRAAEADGMPEEATVEINPEDLTDGIMELEGLATRISIGVQSLDPRTLAALGRNSSREAAAAALSRLSGLPFDFNADIITAVPGQAIGGTLRDIEAIASYGPGHISALMHPCKTFAEYRGAVVTGRDDKIAFVIDVAIQGVRVAYKSESVVV